MTFLPILSRELGLAARRSRTYWGRMASAAFSVALAGVLLPALASPFSVTQGKMLFNILSGLAFYYSLLAGARLTADCISAEKREGTLGLLFLTDLRGYDVVFGKLASCSLSALYGLLAIVPVLSLALLLGGVTLSEIGRMALLLLNTLFFSMSVGVFVSTLSRNDRRAAFATFCTILLVCGGPYVLVGACNILLDSGMNLEPDDPMLFSLTPSPVFAALLLGKGPLTGMLLWAFYGSILVTHLIAWMLLAVASGLMPRVCRERPPERVGLRWAAFRQRWSYGSLEHRRAFRRRLLDRNAFYWLAARDRVKANYAWIFVVSMTAIWVWSGWQLGGFAVDWNVSAVLLLFIFAFFKVWVTSEIGSRFVEDRSNGAFELLLSSPIDLREMARGQSLALWRQFAGPIAVVVALSGFLIWSALRATHEGLLGWEVILVFAALLGMLWADLAALKWVSMWQAVSSSKINKAMSAASSRILVLPTVLFLVAWGVLWLAVIGSGYDFLHPLLWAKVTFLWLAIGLLNDLFFGLRARWCFLHQFREVATQRFANPPPLFAPFQHAWQSFRASVGGAKRAPDPAQSIRWTYWLVRAPIVAVVVILFAFWFWRHQGSRQLEVQLAKIRAAGEPTTVAELRGWLPIVPDPANAGLLLKNAEPFLMMLNSPNTRPSVTSLQWTGRQAAFSASALQELSSYVASGSNALRCLHDAAALRQCALPIDWSTPLPQMAPIFDFSRLQQAPQLLECEALLALHERDQPRMIQALDSLFGAANALAQEPFYIAQRLRLSALSAALQVLERSLNHEPLPPLELQRLSARLEEAERATGPALRGTFIADRCLGLLPISARQWATATSGTGMASLGVTFNQWFQQASGMRDRQRSRILQVASEMIQKAGMVGSRDAEALDLAVDESLLRNNPYGRFDADAFRASWQRLINEQVEVAVRLRVARTALAVENFRAAHRGSLPISLEALVPTQLRTLPLDPFATNAVLRYQPKGSGFVVYSIGRDRRDGGGEEGATHRFAETTSTPDITFTVQRPELGP